MSTVRWPITLRWRNSLRLLFALPYVAIAIRAHQRGFLDGANAALDHSAGQIRWGSANLSFIGHITPPLPIALAGLLPGSLGLALVGALAAGVVLEAIGARLAERYLPLPVAALVLIGFGGSPSFAFTATTDLRSFMALTFLALAIDGFLRFALKAETHGGFQAGLALGLASLCDPVAIVCAIGFAAAAPLIARSRFRGEPAVGRATAAVLLFPTVAGCIGWSFLCWRFSGNGLDWLHLEAPTLGFHNGPWYQLSHAVTGLERPVLLTPIYLLALVILIARRHPAIAAGITLPLACAVIAQTIGLQFSGLWLAVLLGVVGAMSLPRRPGPWLVTAIVAAALAGPALKWALVTNPALLHWQQLTLR